MKQRDFVVAKQGALEGHADRDQPVTLKGSIQTETDHNVLEDVHTGDRPGRLLGMCI